MHLYYIQITVIPDGGQTIYVYIQKMVIPDGLSPGEDNNIYVSSANK